jgi:hypothetical protein
MNEGGQLKSIRELANARIALVAKDAEIARLRAAWEIAEPFLPSPVYQCALAALKGK